MTNLPHEWRVLPGGRTSAERTRTDATTPGYDTAPPPSPVLTQARPAFNKIRVGGFEADLEGYAFHIEDGESTSVAQLEGAVTNPAQTLEPSNTKKRAVLFYLSMVGHKASVKAIWAALVNYPPKMAVLYYEASDQALFSLPTSLPGEGEGESETDTRAENGLVISPPGQASKPKAIMVELAGRERVGGWQFFHTQLPRARAFQGVLLPRSAHTTGNGATPTKIKKTTGAGTSRLAEFVILDLSATSLSCSPGLSLTDEHDSEGITSETAIANEANLELVQLYYQRLNQLVRLPLHPGWASWLWQRGYCEGEIIPLQGGLNGGVVAGSNGVGGLAVYLCRCPDQTIFEQAVSQAIAEGKLKLA
jgi:hypothetical protein